MPLPRTSRASSIPLRRGVIGGFLVLALFLTGAGPSWAQGLTLGFSGGAGIFGGIGKLSGDQWLGRARNIGSGLIRVSVGWASVAPATRPARFNPSDPASPGYNWSSVDAMVKSVHAQGMSVLLTIQGAPTWAQDGPVPSSATPGSWKPDPAQLGAFGTAIATRYDGRYADPTTKHGVLPRVTDYQAWNEPNLSIYLAPQWIKSGGTYTPEGPALLRSMQNSFYAAVKKVSGTNFVILAGTAPFGDPPGGQRMPPVEFYRDLFCLSPTLTAQSCPSGVSFDAVDHHPYGVGAPTEAALNPDDAAVPDIHKITQVLDAAEKAGRALPRGPKQVWATEIGWNSRPPESTGVPVATQARWLEQSLYLLWKQGVSTVMWLQIVDVPPVQGQPFSFQDSGIYYQSGRAKLAETAFAFPFVTQRLDSGHISAWGRAPVSGTVAIQRQSGSRWVTIAHIHAGARAIFQARVAQTGAAAFRAQVAGQTSLTWSES